MIFKRCPSLRMALVDLFNYCWAQPEIPSQWKFAVIKLIGKSSAADDPTSPSNFRPIALTSCVGKLFTTILRNRWLSYMTTNGYLDKSVQKAFMKATPGCIEHQSKLAAILAEARKAHKSLAVCWLDLANAYGSVHHSLIQFSVQHYHAPLSSATSSSHFTQDSLVQSSAAVGPLPPSHWKLVSIRVTPCQSSFSTPSSTLLWTPYRPDQTWDSQSLTLIKSTSYNTRMTFTSLQTALQPASTSLIWRTHGCSGQECEQRSPSVTA